MEVDFLVNIGPARSADVPWIVAGHLATALVTLPPARQAAVDVRVLRRHLSGEITKIVDEDAMTRALLVARTAEGQPAGYVWVQDRIAQFTDDVTAYVYGIYVVPEYRRQGIGRALMDAAEKWALSHGHTILALTVAGDNGPAMKLYEGLGFGEDTKVMSKQIG